ncbi:polyketide synthase [Streptomyces albulus]|nr:polyketide synthase [Streptomyces noursei]
MLLKPLDRAVADGDRVYAVLKGIAVNNSGRTAGPTAPSFEAQKDVLRTALERSGLHGEDIGHVETNGSGSQVTDLLELKAIQDVYRAGSDRPLTLGSVKPSIGHPLCAEGIAAFLKAVLSLVHRQQAPFLSGQEPLDHFDLAASPFRFPRAVEGWTDRRPVAAVNCFADGGANAAAILAAWDDAAAPTPVRKRCPRPCWTAARCPAPPVPHPPHPPRPSSTLPHPSPTPPQHPPRAPR